MANFINTYPDGDKLRILFLRESRGVYRFGTKRVNIKLERDVDLKVKIGGGWISLKEFIEQYMYIELEKVRSRSRSRTPSKRYHNPETLSDNQSGRSVDSHGADRRDRSNSYHSPRDLARVTDNRSQVSFRSGTPGSKSPNMKNNRALTNYNFMDNDYQAATSPRKKLTNKSLSKVSLHS